MRRFWHLNFRNTIINSNKKVSKGGFCAPPAIVGCALTTVGAGLMTTFVPSISTGKWIGYQILVGAGRGLSIQVVGAARQANRKTSISLTGTIALDCHPGSVACTMGTIRDLVHPLWPILWWFGVHGVCADRVCQQTIRSTGPLHSAYAQRQSDCGSRRCPVSF